MSGSADHWPFSSSYTSAAAVPRAPDSEHCPPATQILPRHGAHAKSKRGTRSGAQCCHSPRRTSYRSTSALTPTSMSVSAAPPCSLLHSRPPMTYTDSPSATTANPFSMWPSGMPGSVPTRRHVLAPGSMLELPCAKQAYILTLLMTLSPAPPLLPVLEKDGEAATSQCKEPMALKSEPVNQVTITLCLLLFF
nr:unnamed protein product [Digitaria exilis]